MNTSAMPTTAGRGRDAVPAPRPDDRGTPMTHLLYVAGIFCLAAWFPASIQIGALLIIVGSFGRLRRPVAIPWAVLIFIGWALLFLWQSWLVATGRTADHRQWGMLGIALATTMVISVLLAVQNGYVAAARIGMEPQARVFSSVSLLGISAFAGLIVAAIRNVRRPDVHRRLMLASFVPMLQAAVARWFQVALSPPGAVGPPPVFVAIPPGLLVWIVFIGALALHDRRAFGRIHPATKAGAAATLAAILLPVLVANTAIWAAIAQAFASLAPRG